MCVNDAVAPSVFLPPLKHLKTCPQNEISRAIASLRHIYLPEVRGSARRRCTQRPATPVAPDATSDLSAIRADPFERTFAIQWLTRFISLSSEVVARDCSSSSLPVSVQALEDAASLLAICAGSAASGPVLRTFTFPLSNEANVASPELISAGPNEISVVIRDAPLESGDFSSVGAQTWGGSCVLAEMIAENPRNFSIYPRGDREPRSPGLQADAPFRALELGAGTGLASLVLGKVLGRIRGGAHRWPQDAATKPVDAVIATDFHPSVLVNLGTNFAVNFPSEVLDSRTHASSPVDLGAPEMVVLPLDWSVIHSLAHPIASSSRISSSFHSADKEDTLEKQSSNDTPTALHRNTDFQSEAWTYRASDRKDIICDLQQFPDSTNLQRRTAYSCPIPSQLDVIPFDLIIGADIIYERSHARWVRSCVERFLRKPGIPHSEGYRHFPIGTTAAAAPGTGGDARDPVPSMMTDEHPSTTALFHLVIPLRNTHAVECRSVEEVFLQARDVLLARQRAAGLSEAQPQPSSSSPDDGTAADSSRGDFLSNDGGGGGVGLELGIVSQEDVWCDAYRDREEGEVVMYRYYRIGWV